MTPKRISIVVLALALSCLTISSAMTMKVHDVKQDETVAGERQRYTIIFSPSMTIEPHNFLLLTWPSELLQSTSYVDSEANKIGAWGKYDSSSCSMSEESTFKIKKSSSHEDFSYHLKFYDSTGDQVPLERSKAYYLIIVNTPANGLTPGSYGPIKMSTITNDQNDKYVTLESNPFAGYIAIQAPLTTMSVFSNTEEGDESVAASKYKIKLALTPTVSISDGYKIKLAIDENISFLDDCVGSPKFASFTVVEHHTRMYHFETSLIGGDVVSMTCELLNPSFELESHEITLTIYEGYTSRAVEQGKVSLSVEPLDASNIEVKAFGALGRPLEDDSDVPAPLVGFFKDCPNCLPVYNSMTLKFNMNTNQLQSGNHYKIRIDTSTGAPLMSSFNHNLPGKMVSCAANSVRIQCTGVEALEPNTDYKISFRFSIPSGFADTDIDPSYGQIRLTDHNDVEIFEIKPSINSTSVFANIDLRFDDINTRDSSEFRDSTLVHTFSGDSESPTPSNSSHGMTYNSQVASYHLVLEYQSSDIDIPEPPSEGAGTEFITTKSIKAASDETPITCAGSSEAVDFGSNALCTLSEKSVQDFTYSSIRFSPGAGWDVQYPSTPSRKQFRISGVLISNVSSVFLIDDYTYDFFIRGTDGLTAENDGATSFGTTKSKALINGYVVNANGDVLASLDYGISLFWTSDPIVEGALGSLDGTKFPAVLRISARLNDTEKDKASHLRLFFTDLRPFAESTGTNKVACTSVDGESNCYLKEAQSISNAAEHPPYAWNSIEILLSEKELNSNSFQILIPVKTTPGKKDLSFALALGKTDPTSSDKTVGGDLVTAYLLFKPLSTYSSSNFDDFEGEVYNLKLNGSPSFNLKKEYARPNYNYLVQDKEDPGRR